MSIAQDPFALTEPRLQALEALLGGATATEAAQACGVPLRTLRDWLQQDDFRSALAAGLAQVLNQAYVQLAAAAVDAIRTLAEISRDPDQKGSVRVAASNKLLSLLGRDALLTAATPTPAASPDPVMAGIMAALERAYGDCDEASNASPSPTNAPPPGASDASRPAAEPPSLSVSPSPPAAPPVVALARASKAFPARDQLGIENQTAIPRVRKVAEPLVGVEPRPCSSSTATAHRAQCPQKVAELACPLGHHQP